MLSCRHRARRELVALLALVSLIVPLATFAATAASKPPAPAATPLAAPSVVSVDVSGNAHVPTDRILAVVRTRVGQRFDEALVRQDVQSIFDLGYFSDQVPPLIRQRPRGIAITFRVIENPVIAQIVFTGNDHVPSDTLLALMDSAVGQVLNTNTFHQDVLKINSYYDKIGYGGQVPTHVANLNIGKDGVLSLQIREGLTVSGIEVSGLPVLSPELIKSALVTKVGQPYSEDTRDKDFDALKKLYEKYDLQLGDFEAGIDPTTIDLSKGTAEVKYSVYAAVVGAVQITGNTKTKDIVIRRQLREVPGVVVTQGGLRRDYERLNNLGFFEKVDLNPKPGPDPKKPYEVTLNWNVKEQRTGTAQVGAGYSGGPTGQGLTGTVSYSENNINGTGNGASLRFERGSRVSDAMLSFTKPYLGNTPKASKYSLSASIFTTNQTNFYQVYQASSAQVVSVSPVISTPPPSGSSGSSGGAPGTIPVVLTPNQNLIAGVAANYANRANGVSLNLGRRLSDRLTATIGLVAQRIATPVTLPAPYFLAGSQTTIVSSTTTSFNQTVNGTTIGISAPSIADTSNGDSFNLRSLTLGLLKDTRDDVFNPRRGANVALTEELSPQGFLGSSFGYDITTFDAAKFFPVLANSTLGFHLLAGYAGGAIPPNKVFTFSDQQLRGYSQVFYGTEEVLGQVELRYPVTKDRKFSLATFFDYGSQRIRGAQPIVDNFGNTVVNYNDWLYHTDAGIGIRFDIPQLGFRSIRLDFAKGKSGTHTSFGIGQSF
jgi:outer membrane protein assembly factor BamA